MSLTSRASRLRRLVAPRPTRAVVRVGEHSVVKIENPARVSREVLEMRAAVAIPRGMRCFEVPELISVDVGRLETRRVPGLVSLRQTLAEAANPELARRAGAALASIHLHMRLPEAEVTLMPAPFDTPDPVPLHGDFTLSNIQYRAETDQLVILDWATPPWAMLLATHGSALWDVSAFLVDLHYQRIREPRRIDDPTQVAASFVDGYRNLRPLDGAALRDYLRLFVSLYLRERTFGLELLGRVPDVLGMARLQRRRLSRFAKSI
ncbi:MAG: hypothetical protein U0904_12420 [Candidatus Nanopelagicales bacterium]|nr:hypothetical protein [Candidatus Nanopelagicales bacterium]